MWWGARSWRWGWGRLSVNIYLLVRSFKTSDYAKLKKMTGWKHFRIFMVFHTRKIESKTVFVGVGGPSWFGFGAWLRGRALSSFPYPEPRCRAWFSFASSYAPFNSLWPGLAFWPLIITLRAGSFSSSVPVHSWMSVPCVLSHNPKGYRFPGCWSCVDDGIPCPTATPPLSRKQHSVHPPSSTHCV